MTTSKSALMMVVAFSLGTMVQACSSSTAQQGGMTAAEVRAIVTEQLASAGLTNVGTRITGIESSLEGVEGKLSIIPVFSAGAPNPVQITPLYPVYFDGPNCTGQAYLHGIGPGSGQYEISPAAFRAGIVTRYTLPGQVDESPETYAWVEPNGQGAQMLNLPVSRLVSEGNCTDGGISAVFGYPVQQQTDAQAFLQLTGVPAGGFLEGTRLSSYTSMPSGGLIGGRYYDMVTSTGFFMRFDALSEPLVARPE